MGTLVRPVIRRREAVGIRDNISRSRRRKSPGKRGGHIRVVSSETSLAAAAQDSYLITPSKELSIPNCLYRMTCSAPDKLHV